MFKIILVSITCSLLNAQAERKSIHQTELEYNNVFQLTVAVILSAQCTDKRVNQITKQLFVDFPDAIKMSKANIKEIYSLSCFK